MSLFTDTVLLRQELLFSVIIFNFAYGVVELRIIELKHLSSRIQLVKKNSW